MFRRRRCVLDTEKVSLCHALRLWETLGVKKIVRNWSLKLLHLGWNFPPSISRRQNSSFKKYRNLESRILLMWRIWSDIVYVLMRNTDKGRGDGGCDVRFQELSINNSLEAFTVYTCTCSKSAVGGCVDKEETSMAVRADWLITLLLDVYFATIKTFYWNDKVCRNGRVCRMPGEAIITDSGPATRRALELITPHTREWRGMNNADLRCVTFIIWCPSNFNPTKCQLSVNDRWTWI